MIIRRKQNQSGFTLVELLVTISIFVVLTGVVLFSQFKFDSTILLTNLAYDTALTIRQAQTFGINIKEFADDKFVPYGVHFDKNAPTSFILFADLDGDNLFKGNTGKCNKDDGCVNRYNIKRGNYIKELCVGEYSLSTKSCVNSGGVLFKLDVTYRRPDPNAYITNGVRGDIELKSPVTIILSSKDGKDTRQVRVWENGLIEIVNQ